MTKPERKGHFSYRNYRNYAWRPMKTRGSISKRKKFKVGQQVLLFHSCLKLIAGKLRSRWDGPFVITNKYEMRLTIKLFGSDSNSGGSEQHLSTGAGQTKQHPLTKFPSPFTFLQCIEDNASFKCGGRGLSPSKPKTEPDSQHSRPTLNLRSRICFEP
ncbi:hypothetical protein CR513_44953, partial [Mucuna pruriens]